MFNIRKCKGKGNKREMIIILATERFWTTNIYTCNNKTWYFKIFS